MIVVLCRVGRNVARCVRIAWSFGAEAIELFDCDPLRGRLYSASAMPVLVIDALPQDVLVLDNKAHSTLACLSVSRIGIGGETSGWPRGDWARARIPTARPLELTADAALSAALYQVTR